MKVIHEISREFDSLNQKRVIVQEMVYQLSAVPISSNSPFVHDQVSPNSSWIVNHNLGYFPLVEILSPGGIVVEAEIFHVTNNQVNVTFNLPQTGKAIAR